MSDYGAIAERLRATRATMLGTADEPHYWDCHDAADAIERLTKERDSHKADAMRLLALEAAQNARAEAAEARVATLEEALRTIEAQSPKEDPGPAFTPISGWKSEGNAEDMAHDLVAERMWKVGEIARSALSGGEK